MTKKQADRRRFRENHLEAERSRSRAYHRRNRTQRTAYEQQWRRENPEKMAQYRERDRVRARELYWARKTP